MTSLTFLNTRFVSIRPATTLTRKINHLMIRAYAAMVIALGSISTASAQAGGAEPDTMLQNILKFILGPFGKSLAILGIIAIGMSWMFGRASLGMVAGVIGGIVIMFGASYLGTSLMGG